MKDQFKRVFVALCIIVAISGWCIVGAIMARPKHPPKMFVHTDTLVVHDTLRDTILVPRIIRRIRIDTVTVKLVGDTVFVDAEIPIERKTYHTEDYLAMIEGFHPQLVSMEIYRKTQTITETKTLVKRAHWGIGLNAGYGIGSASGRIIATPYVGAGVSYNLWSW